MEDSKAMSQPGSPHAPPHAELSDSLGTLPAPEADCGASVPLHAPTLLHSSQPSVSAPTVTKSLQETATPVLKEDNPMKTEELYDTGIMPWAAFNNSLISNNLLMNSMAAGDPSLNLPMQCISGSTATHSYDHSAFVENCNLAYQPDNPASYPRSLDNNIDLTGLPSSRMSVSSSYPPRMYQMGPQQPYECMDLQQSPNNNLIELEHEYDAYPRPIAEDFTAYGTPYDSDVSQATSPNDGSLFPVRNDGAFDKDRPYAQLIFDALRQAPNHTMILRDIYDWFRKNTDKAADKDTKGWQNSIRHNLSMNGAFEKVDHPCEDARKGFMWRLTDDALVNGVKSTTRYRSKQPNKRGHRTGLYPQRQRAGAMGGKSAKKQLRHKARMQDGYRSNPYQTPSRTMPTPATFEPSIRSDMSMYTGSPYYSSSGSEVDHMEYQPNAYSSPLEARRLDMSQPLLHGLPLSSSTLSSYDNGYFHPPSDPAEPLFTNSPSPSASEPRTPGSDAPGWNDNFFGSISSMGQIGSGFDAYMHLGDINMGESGFGPESLSENQ